MATLRNPANMAGLGQWTIHKLAPASFSGRYRAFVGADMAVFTHDAEVRQVELSAAFRQGFYMVNL